MGRSVLRRRIHNLLVFSSLGALTTALGACSSGYERFDYNAAVPQSASAQAQNPYPGVDSTTTASTTRPRITPAASVAPRIDPQGVYHRPEPTFAARQTPNYQQPQRQAFNGYPQKTPAQPAYNQPTYTPPTYTAPTYTQPSYSQPSYTPPTAQAPTYTPPSYSNAPAPNYNAGNVQRSNLSAPQVSPAPTAPQYSYTPPKPDSGAKTVYIPPAPKPDAIQTASVPQQTPREQGWTATGGTKIRIRQGETLYNLSKRYGVPVDEIRRANNLRADATIKADQLIVIPTYVYGPTARVSAPDNDPNTRAASASTGYLGQAQPGKVAIPTKKPSQYRVAASQPMPEAPSLRDSYNRQTQAYPGDSAQYQVQSGDSLSKIAKRYGTSVAELQRVNGISGTNIRIGQKLTLPQSVDTTTTASVQGGNPYGVDPIVTGSTKTAATNLPATGSQYTAPAASGISKFRWPVKGRVIEKFGAQVAEGSNEGIDISVPEGTAVRAAENGVVIYTGEEISEYGKLVLVRHSDGWVSAYAHNRDFEVRKGEKVARGQIIARSGRTGQTELPKLHFELRKNSVAVDPAQYLSGA